MSVQNHLLQIVGYLAMEPPSFAWREALRDEQAKVLRTIRPLSPAETVLGQFRGYRGEAGVKKGSNVPTYAALHLFVDSWRWQGVPFHVTAGKCLSTTRSEVLVKLKPSPGVVFREPGVPDGNYVRFTLSPQVRIAIGARAKRPGDGMFGEPVELSVMENESSDRLDAYERLIGDAMDGDPTLFARQDAVEAAWAIVNPVLEHGNPLVRVRMRQRRARGSEKPRRRRMGMTGRRVVTDDVAVLQRVFAAEFTVRAAEIIARRGRFIVALPGGSVAITFLPVLAGLAVDWAHIDLFWVDERAVPPDHPDSNYGIASRLLLRPACVPPPRDSSYAGGVARARAGRARRASDELKSVAGDPPRWISRSSVSARTATSHRFSQACPRPCPPTRAARRWMRGRRWTPSSPCTMPRSHRRGGLR
jgi:hypothetical protein